MAGLSIEVQPTAEPITLAEAKIFLREDSTDSDLLITAMIKAAREACEVFTGRSFCNKGYLLTLDSFPYFLDSQVSQNNYPPQYYSGPQYSTTMWNYSQMIKLWKPPCISVDRISYLASADSQWHDLTPAPALWFPKAVHLVNDLVMDNQGNVQKCTTAGTSTANPPAWNYTQGGSTSEVQDAQGEGTGTVVWLNMGKLSSLLGDNQFGFYILDKTTHPARLFPGPVSSLWPTVLYVPGSVQIHYTAGYGADGTNVPAAVKIAMLQCLANWYENHEAAQMGVWTELPNHCKMLLWSLKIMDFQPTRG